MRSRSVPPQRTTRQILSPSRVQVPTHRAATLDLPSGNNTGVPLTPCDLDPRLPSLAPAPTEDEDDGLSTAESAGDSKPKTIPEETAGSDQIDRIDNLPVPSPADIPEDMKYDPGGEGTPGLMPPVPAPVPEDEQRSSVVDDYTKLVDLGPLGPDDYNED